VGSPHPAFHGHWAGHQLTPDRRQINRKSAQKHRMRRREEHDTLSKSMVEKDARIAQLEKELAVERSKTAQLQQFIDMQRGGGKRGGGRRKEEDVDMEDW
jgi:arginine deiminase